jgi:hypothetical protein
MDEVDGVEDKLKYYQSYRDDFNIRFANHSFYGLLSIFIEHRNLSLIQSFFSYLPFLFY